MQDEQDKSQAFTDIANAIYNLRIQFLKHGMSPPKMLELSSHDDGLWFRVNMPRELAVFQPRMGEHQKDAQWICNILGIEITMPACWRTDHKNKNHLDDITDYTLLPEPKP